MTPDVTLTGLLHTIAGAPDAGTVSITLVNYGSNQPQVQGNSIMSQVVTKVQAASDGTFSVNLWGNDQITPQNTLYEVAIYPSGSQAVTSVKTYRLNSGTYDLSNLIPVQTSLPPSAFTPVVSVNGKTGYITLTAADLGSSQTFQYVNSTTTTTVDFSQSVHWTITLKGAATINFANAQPLPMTLIITQDSTGSWPVSWASNIPGPPPPPGSNPGSSTVYQFAFDGTNFILSNSPIATG